MYDSIRNVGDFLSPHWLSEAFPAKLKTLTKEWRERNDAGKGPSPLRGLTGVTTRFLDAKADLPGPRDDGFSEAVTYLHTLLLGALGLDAEPVELVTEQSETPVTVPLLVRRQAPTGEALHVLQAAPVADVDDLFGDEGRLLYPVQVQSGPETTTAIESVPKAVQQLFLTDHAPRFILVVAGGWLLLSDVERWAEGRYLAFDVDTALSRRDDKAAGELAWLAGLVSADVLLPAEDGGSLLGAFSDDSIKHAVGVSEDLREGLRRSVELIADEVIVRRRARGEPVESIPELPRELTSQSLRFLYRILFLLYAEARPELAILPVGAPEYDAGYGLDRLRDLIQRPLTGPSRDGHHLHDSLRLLFRLVNQGHGDAGSDGDGLVFEPLRADLFDRRHAYHIDDVDLSNAVLQQVLALLLLSKPSKSRGARRGYVSYAQLGINQLGAVYEGLMAYSGFIAERELVELAKDGDPRKGTWLVPRERLGEYEERHVVHREDQITGATTFVLHRPGTFVYRLSGRDRQRSASYYTPEVLTQCVVRHSLAELITKDTPAAAILEYRVCEPAMGSGAFLNEALNQLAAEYLKRRQAELDQAIDPGQYRQELQRVKAYLALHRCYGVDLNDTARELAEVSLWLNVMHPGLKAPWFGLHLRRGNSLIGARRATYDLAALGRAKKSWLDTPPIDRALSAGAVPDGEIHYFLLPAAGWGAVKDAKPAKELAPDAVARLKAWTKSVTRKPGKDDTARLRGLARRVERLWELSLRRLEISEREVSRHVEVWGADLPAEAGAVSREEVESALHDPDGPYQRLRLAMDAWCALFFWPVTTDVEPPDLVQWINALEGLLGVSGKPTDAYQIGFVEIVEGFSELADLDDLEKTYYGMRDVAALLLDHRWLGVVREISQQEGFFHWELDFAQVFHRGGFDLQLGNPPWVRPIWQDDETLSEFEPFFTLQEKIPESILKRRRTEVLSSPEVAVRYLEELSSWAGLNRHLRSDIEHPVLRGVQSNLYTNFIERTWRSSGGSGIVGLLHPDGHFIDANANVLRAETYVRLRLHAQFTNKFGIFEDVSSSREFGINVYGPRQSCGFRNLASLFHPSTLDASLTHDGRGDSPGLQDLQGRWSKEPHSSRVAKITEPVLMNWARLFDPEGTPALQARLVRPLTSGHLEVLDQLSASAVRLADFDHAQFGGWHEKSAKERGYIEYQTVRADNLAETILQANHIQRLNPYGSEPNEDCRNRYDWSDVDPLEVSERWVPRTNYQRACGMDEYLSRSGEYKGHSSLSFYRLAWGRMVDSTTERTLEAAVVPPGPAHVNTVYSLAVSGSRRRLTVAAGLWASIALDYLVKVSGKTDVTGELVSRFPAPLDHPAATFVLLRTLRLNCLTEAFAELWEEQYEPGFAGGRWTTPFADWPKLGVDRREWRWETPLRSEFERRAALVEIDALAAIMLGLTPDQLCLIYRGQFAVLRKYEYNMWFDNLGHKIAKDHHAHGVRQQPDDFALLQAYLNDEDSGDLLERYEEPITPVDREAEMRAAYADFVGRLG